MRNNSARCYAGGVNSNAGEEYHVLYEPRFNGSRIVLDEVGREEIQPKINAFAPYTDLMYMLSRLKVGDSSVLSSSSPLYGDFSAMPDNPIDAINLVHNAEAKFLALPAEEKGRYNNDFKVWLASMFSSAELAVGDVSRESMIENKEEKVDEP